MAANVYEDIIVPGFNTVLAVGGLWIFMKYIRHDAEDFLRHIISEIRELAEAKWTVRSYNALGTILLFGLVVTIGGAASIPIFGGNVAAASWFGSLLLSGVLVIFLFALVMLLCVHFVMTRR